jgi:hypothetical protein
MAGTRGKSKEATEKVEIRNRWSGEVQFTAEIVCSPDTLPSIKLGLAVKAAYLVDANLVGANLAGAYLVDANLADANLARANLADANLARANLAGAYLAGAYLVDANLAGANLAGAYLVDANLARAYLAGARGFIPERTTHLASIKFLPVCHAFKVVNERGEGHINGGLKYHLGKRVEVKDADPDPSEMCSKGIHVADLPWCLNEWREGYRIILIEHSPADIACVPLGTDGKYRLHGCTPVRDITDELRECGALPKIDVKEAA